jgi:hypothetical protein
LRSTFAQQRFDCAFFGEARATIVASRKMLLRLTQFCGAQLPVNMR